MKPTPSESIRSKGRPAHMLKCKLCKAELNTSDMRLHEPGCRRDHLLVPGKRLHLKAEPKPIVVEILQVFENFGSLVKNIKTGRVLTVKSPRAFREWMNSANIRFARKRKPAARPKRRARAAK
jgi:hypothetical protein